MKRFELLWNARLRFLSRTVNIDNLLFKVFSVYVVSFVPTLS